MDNLEKKETLEESLDEEKVVNKLDSMMNELLNKKIVIDDDVEKKSISSIDINNMFK